MVPARSVGWVNGTRSQVRSVKSGSGVSGCLGFRLKNLESFPRFEDLEGLSLEGLSLEGLSLAGLLDFPRFPKKDEGLLMELPMTMLQLVRTLT
jgi:hypothetical protein